MSNVSAKQRVERGSNRAVGPNNVHRLFIKAVRKKHLQDRRHLLEATDIRALFDECPSRTRRHPPTQVDVTHE
ncbi:hypothetical protein D3C79_950060 [compost metagenome]